MLGGDRFSERQSAKEANIVGNANLITIQVQGERLMIVGRRVCLGFTANYESVCWKSGSLQRSYSWWPGGVSDCSR